MRPPLFILLFASIGLLAACESDTLPPGVLEFDAPVGTFRVTAPEKWVETPELGGYTAVESPDLDFVFSVVAVNPPDAQAAQYLNPREYTKNGRAITIYDGIPGGIGIFYGVEVDPEDALIGVVRTDAARYSVILMRSTTVVKTDVHEQTLVDLAASLESVQ
jgi:hypothetical protein